MRRAGASELPRAQERALAERPAGRQPRPLPTAAVWDSKESGRPRGRGVRVDAHEHTRARQDQHARTRTRALTSAPARPRAGKRRRSNAYARPRPRRNRANARERAQAPAHKPHAGARRNLRVHTKTPDRCEAPNHSPLHGLRTVQPRRLGAQSRHARPQSCGRSTRLCPLRRRSGTSGRAGYPPPATRHSPRRRAPSSAVALWHDSDLWCRRATLRLPEQGDARPGRHRVPHLHHPLRTPQGVVASCRCRHCAPV